MAATRANELAALVLRVDGLASRADAAEAASGALPVRVDALEKASALNRLSNGSSESPPGPTTPYASIHLKGN